MHSARTWPRKDRITVRLRRRHLSDAVQQSSRKDRRRHREGRFRLAHDSFSSEGGNGQFARAVQFPDPASGPRCTCTAWAYRQRGSARLPRRQQTNLQPFAPSSSMNTSGASTARARSTKSTRLRTSTSRERSCARAPNCRAKSFSAWAGGSYDRRAAEGQDLWPRRGYRRAQQDRRGRHGRRRVDDLTRDKRSPGQGGRPGLPYQRGDRRERSPGSE